MIDVIFRVRKLHPDARTPAKAHAHDAGWDVASREEDFPLRPGERRAVRTGIALDVPAGYEVQVRPRSGLAVKHGVTVLNAPSTIDAGYEGEILVVLVNHGEEAFEVKKGTRIAQLVPQKVLECVFLEEMAAGWVGQTMDGLRDLQAISDKTIKGGVRGGGGFGSSGT